jgi:uncharacterized protein (DUF1501 family)
MNHKSSLNFNQIRDQKSHDLEHVKWSRRNFLRDLGLAGGLGLGLGGFDISALAATPFINPVGGINDRILVLIRLKGGNDGLNMIVPLFDYSTYKANRPSISIAQNDIINLGGNNKFGMPKSMSPLKSMWDKGAMKIVNSVGYPDHNLSHFTSSDIWNAANQAIDTSDNKSGWLGRFLLDRRPDYLTNLPDVPGAIKINSGSNIAYQTPDRIDLAISFNTPEKLIEIAEKGFVFDTLNLPDDCTYGDQIGFLRSILNITYKYAPNISNAYSAGTNAVSYSTNELSRQLAIVARLIKGNLGTKLYMVTLDGFDTHENQNNTHPKLMNDISKAVSEFYSDLAAGQKDKDVLSMTYSEFGRRVRENEGGTDHGTAAPVMFFGPALEGNDILGEDPDLKDLDSSGNLKHGTDFRSLYATLLESWMCIDAASVDNILGDSYDRIPNLGFECTTVSVNDQMFTQFIKHQVRTNGDGSHSIHYETTRPGPVTVEIFTIMGQKIATLVNEYQFDGKHECLFINPHAGLSAAMYVYNIRSGKQHVSGKII